MRIKINRFITALILGLMLVAIQPLPTVLADQYPTPPRVTQLEKLLKIKLTQDSRYRGIWNYTRTTADMKKKKYNSSYTVRYRLDKDVTTVAIVWCPGVKDLSQVSVDLAPVQKVMDLYFPRSPKKNEVLYKVEELVARSRANWQDKTKPLHYYIDGYTVALGNNDFVNVVIYKGAPYSTKPQGNTKVDPFKGVR
ncbi:MAG: hypothetical protein ACM3UZ_00305 [Acidobacteriota bacterium]